MQAAGVEAVRDGGAEPADRFQPGDGAEQQVGAAEPERLRLGERHREDGRGGVHEPARVGVVEVERVHQDAVGERRLGARHASAALSAGSGGLPDDARLGASAAQLQRGQDGGVGGAAAGRGDRAAETVQDVPERGAPRGVRNVPGGEPERPFRQCACRGHGRSACGPKAPAAASSATRCAV